MDGRKWGDELADRAFKEATAGMDDTKCTGGLVVEGEFFPCDGGPDHAGWACSSRKAEAIWRGMNDLALGNRPNKVLSGVIEATNPPTESPGEGAGSQNAAERVETADAQKVTEVADLILSIAVCEGREGSDVTAADRDTESYLHCQHAAAAVLAALDLPARDARVRAETLRDAADAIEATRSTSGIASRALDPGRVYAVAVLRDRAAATEVSPHE